MNIQENRSTSFSSFPEAYHLRRCFSCFLWERNRLEGELCTFVRFDEKINMLQAGVPGFIFPDPIAGRQKLGKLALKYFNEPHPDCDQLVTTFQQHRLTQNHLQGVLSLRDVLCWKIGSY